MTRDERLARVRAMVERGEIDKADEEVKDLQASNPDDEEILICRADIQERLAVRERSRERADEAMALYELALSRNSNCAAAHFGKGNLLGNSGESKAAEACYKRCLALDPRHYEAWYDLGILYRDHFKAPEMALYCLNESLQIEPVAAGVLFEKGKTYSLAGCYEEALACFEEALRHSPRYSDALSAKATILMKLRKPGAVEFLTKEAGGRILIDLY